jgi:AcrR family transcriptional regulator
MLAAACNITEPALYRHFSSKEAIYDAVLGSLGSRLDCESLFVSLEREDDVEVILRELALHIIKFSRKNQDVFRLLLYSALAGHARAKRVHRTIRGVYENFLVRQLNRLYRKRLIVKKNNEITARCFVGMVFDCALSVTLWRGFRGREFRAPQIVANNVPIYARGLRR